MAIKKYFSAPISFTLLDNDIRSHFVELCKHLLRHTREQNMSKLSIEFILEYYWCCYGPVYESQKDVEKGGQTYFLSEDEKCRSSRS